MSVCFQDNNTAPGAMIPANGNILINAQRRTVKLKVTSLCDRPIQVCAISDLLVMHWDMNCQLATFAGILVARYFFHLPWQPKWLQLGALY